MTRLKEGILYNEDDCLTLNGDEKTIGSKRISIDPDTDNAVIKKLVSEDIWQPDSFEFGPGSVLIGKNIKISGVGHHIATEHADQHLHTFAHNEFDGLVTIHDMRALNAYDFTPRAILQGDNSGTWTGKTQEFTILSPAHLLANDGYLQTDTVAATKPIRYRIWQGTDDTGPLIFDQTYPASEFPASTEVQFIAYGYVEFESGETYFHRIVSVADFSLKMDVTNTTPWFASDISFLSEDNMLQTTPWVSGAMFTANDWLIDSRKIYVCNVTGVQTGTFAGNMDKWDPLHDGLNENFSYEKVISSKTLTIPEYQQMAVFGTFTVDGNVNLEGSLVLRN